MGKPELFPANIYCRVRPTSTGEKDGHGAGEAVEKSLAGFEEAAMIIKDSHGEQRFEFPKAVLGPDSMQEGVYDTIAPELLEGFLVGENNALLFAYGQTGTGKTHTMFGPGESHKSATPHEDWGLLPRVVHATLESMQASTGSKSAILALSAIEFYCFAAWDLNADVRNLVTMTSTGDVYGHTYTQVQSVTEISGFIDRVYGNRKVVATKMNAGSSRSHVCIILTLYQVDNASGDFTQSSFSIVDLAGSERPGKTGMARMDAGTAVLEAKRSLETGKALSGAAQGSLINMELTLIQTAFVRATESWAKNRPFKPQMDWAPSMWYLTGACQGQARLAVVVAISQSPQNGWETWFSCTWGENVAKLKAPCHKQKAKGIAKVIKAATKEKAAAAEALAKQGSSASAQKFAAYRQGIASYAAQRLQYLEQLNKMRSGAAGSAPADDGGPEDGEEPPLLMELMALELRCAFKAFDRNGDGNIDVEEMASILSRGTGPQAFSPEMARKLAGEVISHFGGEDGKSMPMEGFIQWWKEESRWSRMSAGEQEAWYKENPEHDHRNEPGYSQAPH